MDHDRDSPEGARRLAVATSRPLDVTNHDRDVVGMRYVYPVVSRRAGGVSVGINLNPNRACNWRCAYCQVPDLVRGRGPKIDLARLDRELHDLLEAIVEGDLLQRSLGTAEVGLRDLAFSGDGEPTTCPDFEPAVEVVRSARCSRELADDVKLVLITNGSMLHQAGVVRGVRRLGDAGGEIWFKLDSATEAGTARINGVKLGLDERLGKLRRATELGPTWIQTCIFRWRGESPAEAEQVAFLRALECFSNEHIPLRGVLLYTVARPPARPEGTEITPLEAEWLEAFAERIRSVGLVVRVSY